MAEFEIKLEVPADTASAVRAELMDAGVHTQRLRAIYFDTDDEVLRRHKMVLRLRKEDDRWMQTLKAQGDRLLQRLEHEVPVPWPADEDTAPAIDLARHQGTPVGRLLIRALRHARAHELSPCFETSVQRLKRTEDVGGSRVEIAFDHGRVTSGGRSRELCELEIELKEGGAAGAVKLAREWCARHGLWLGMVSKAEKGMRLAGGQLFGPAASDLKPDVPAGAGARALVREIFDSCLEQVLINAGEIAAGSSDGEHVHQLRVGIRRLRTASREIGGSLNVDLGARWEESLVSVFRELGRHRDHHRVMRRLESLIEQAGGPMLDTRQLEDEVSDPGALVRSHAFQDALLGLVGLAHEGIAAADGKGAGNTRKQLRRRLRKLHSQCLRDGRKFARLDPVRQHRVRKRLKRLRYLSEFLTPLFGKHDTRAFLARLKPVQDALGLYNDEVMALEMYRGLAGKDPQAWFAVGWLSARAPLTALQCEKTLRDFSKVQPFWI